jgi:two-component system, OmpR family, response regulator
MRALLVEDDHMIAEAITLALQDAAYSVDWVEDGPTADSALARHHFEVVLLDLGLPGRDGLDVLRKLRAKDDDVPVIIISARDGVQTRIEGLDIGADDYLVKPFEPAELLARIRAVARRKTGSAQPLLGNGIISLDPASKIATVAEVEHALTKREFALLRELLLRPGAILSRTELEDRIYGWADEVESNVVEYIIHSLRKKLGADVIKNVRGLGWMVERRG